MATEPFGCQDNRMTDKEKAERLAAALRENLRRRKAQARELGAGAPAKEEPRSGPRSENEEN
jgi:hypothetical protein